MREARQAQGLHIAALAATIKVAQRKLEALEADRLDELPDATFTRALAQTVCRALKIDPAPVLALLPSPMGHRLEHVSEGINAPFRDRPGRHEPNDWSVLASPAVWGPLLVLVAAAAVWLLPSGWLPSLQPAAGGASAPSHAASSGLASVVVPPSAVIDAASAPAAGSAPEAPAAAPMAPSAAASAVSDAAADTAGPLRLRAIAASWVEIHDARRQVLLSRVVDAGESVVIDGAMPLRVKIGNARATEVMFRGRALDLAPNTRDNVARLELN
ncbi:MAG TPA: helix-turn-helix domain-containing protein [Albitalea sp.]|uniref:helix-turn-helix domain-containing protein n=1 Tax=Piscinibacter sp. TaxID=1903157 RepID=UPI002ED1B6BC